MKVLRVAMGLTQDQLARQVGCSQAAISRLEKGQSRKLDDSTRIKIARALDVAPQVLFPYEDAA